MNVTKDNNKSIAFVWNRNIL